jgi:gamma-glutamyltranspeptidase
MAFAFTHPSRTWRPVAIGRAGAVGTNHPLATQAGAQVLRAGGNAVDAAIAVATTLGVVEPQMSGVGGDGFFLVYEAEARRATLVNATGPAPRAATVERFAHGLPADGILTASTPGVVDGWLTLAQRFGTQPLNVLFEAAIGYARDGFGCTRALHDFIDSSQAVLRKDARTARTFLADGQPPRVGQTIRQPDLAVTLEAIAAGGRAALYEGEVGRALARFCDAENGLIGVEDLRDYQCEITNPIRTSYRGLEILQAAPNSMGWVMLLELNIVEHFDLASMGAFSADAIHTLVEAKKLAFADRERFSADPRFFEAPLDELLSKDHAARLAAQIDPRRATPRAAQLAGATAGGDTTYFAVVDRWGNAVSGIQSLSDLFGSGVTAGTTGILLNNRMRPWHLEPDHPNALRPGKRVRHTMNTPLALENGQVRAVWGTPGADAQVQTNLQTLTALVDFELDPQQALEAPRWCSFEPGQETTWPHTGSEHLQVEGRFEAHVLADLASRGHQLEVVGPLDGPCSAQTVVRLDDGTLVAGADPRRDGVALAW